MPAEMDRTYVEVRHSVRAQVKRGAVFGIGENVIGTRLVLANVGSARYGAGPSVDARHGAR